jgi:3'-5' exoribonuclease
MFGQLKAMIESVKNPYLHTMLSRFFLEDEAFMKSFAEHSAAKTVHHSFIGGLMEHTLSVARLCEYMAEAYPLIKRDMLITAALLHDIGKTRELSSFPLNDYTDEGQLLGHIYMGAQMIHDMAQQIEGFPEDLERQLVHCILAHHGELEYGSPKKPALVEAVALNLADNTDARMQTLTELFAADKGKKEWLGFNRIFESNLRRTGDV